MNIVDRILELFEARGDAAYFGEPVSQTQHALQAAHFAEEEGAQDALVTAALVHDIGHLVHGYGEQIADQGVDARHEEAGSIWLADHFGLDVTEPVRLHVAAKRYLCAVGPAYLGLLSPASLQSLELQGGPLSAEEARAFEEYPFSREAAALRRWDDRAKVPGLVVPALDHYRSRLEAAIRIR